MNGDKIYIADKSELENHVNNNEIHLTLDDNAKINSIGLISDLKTTNKNNLVGAINELFINVSNGKDKIAKAITDRSGINTTSKNWAEMATSIMNISTGNKFANGTATYQSDNNNGFRKEDLNDTYLYKNNYITATGFDFVPKTIFIMGSGSSYTTLGIYLSGEDYGSPPLIRSGYFDELGEVYGKKDSYRAELGSAYVGYGSFKLPIYIMQTPKDGMLKWYAYE